MAQNKDHDYYRRYMNSGPKIFLVGANFAKRTPDKSTSGLRFQYK